MSKFLFRKLLFGGIGTIFLDGFLFLLRQESPHPWPVIPLQDNQWEVAEDGIGYIHPAHRLIVP